MLKDKIIIVTGAGSGIGLATAVILAQAGAKVVVSERSEVDLEQPVKTIRDAGGQAVAVTADVSKEAEVAAMVERALSSFGRLDGAFNNAGVEMHNKLVEDLDAGEWDGVLDVNAKGVFLCMKHEIKAMRKTGRRRYRQQLVDEWRCRHSPLDRVYRLQARRDWSNARRRVRGAGDRSKGQCRSTRADRHADD